MRRTTSYCGVEPRSLVIAILLLFFPGCGSSESATPASAGGTGFTPDASVDGRVEQYANLCAKRRTELASGLCPGGDADCASGCSYFFSSALGDDGLDGKTAAVGAAGVGPWKSLAKIESLNLKPGDVLCLHKGDTFRQTVQLASAIHAPSNNPVVIRSYGAADAAKPIISGSRLLPSAWKPSTISPKIMQLDVAGTLWRGAAFQRQGKSYTPHERVYQLFVDGQPQRLARFPNEGQGESTILGLALQAGNYSLIDAAPSASQLLDAQLPSTNSATGSAIDWTGARLYQREIRWIINALDVTAHDAASHTLRTDGAMSCATDNCVGWGYFLLDHLGALDAPGEWFYDASAQLIYFWPPDGVNLATAVIEASTYRKDVQPPSWAAADALPETRMLTGLDLQSASGIHVRGLAFKQLSGSGLASVSTISSGSADSPVSSTDIRIEGCDFLHTGTTGVAVQRWGDVAGAPGNNVIDNNSFNGQLSQAVFLQTTKSDVTCNTVADVGLFESYPRFGMFGNGLTPSEHGMAILATAGDVSIAYNRVQRTASAGISFRGPNTTVAYNFIRRACTTKSDCGGIHTYVWDDATKFDSPNNSGSLVFKNIVLDSLGSSEGDGRGYETPMAQGLFLDFGSHDYVVKENVVALSTSTGILLARNRNVAVDGNLLYANLQDNDWNYPYSQLQIETEYPPVNASVTNNVIFSAAPLQIPMGMRGVDAAAAGKFDHNTYFDPFAYDATSAEHRLTNYLNFVAPGDESTRRGYHLREWATVGGEANAAGAPYYWQAQKVTQELSGNLIQNGTFDGDLSGWSKASWAASSIARDVHPVLGPSLRYDRNGAQGGGIGALSNGFPIEAGQTYWVHLWLAPADGVAVPLPPVITIGNADQQNFLPCDRTREIAFTVRAAETVSNALLELTPYPLYGDRFFIDDVVVKKVNAAPYDSGTVIRFDEPLPAGVRSLLAYNDTDAEQSLVLGTARMSDTAGVVHAGTVKIPAFGAVVLVPEDWTRPPAR
jgi:hypothetical protein